MAPVTPSRERGPGAGLAIRFGILHDQAGPPKRDGTRLIEDGTVTGVVPRDAPAPPGAAVVEAACVIPGLVNAHARRPARQRDPPGAGQGGGHRRAGRAQPP